jgi:hypothetical protein
LAKKWRRVMPNGSENGVGLFIESAFPYCGVKIKDGLRYFCRRGQFHNVERRVGVAVAYGDELPRASGFARENRPLLLPQLGKDFQLARVRFPSGEPEKGETDLFPSATAGLLELTWGRQVRENPLHLTPYDYI